MPQCSTDHLRTSKEIALGGSHLDFASRSVTVASATVTAVTVAAVAVAAVAWILPPHCHMASPHEITPAT